MFVNRINYVEMLLGTNDLQRVEETEVRRESSDFKIHEKFNMTNSEYNIALIKIEKDVPIIGKKISSSKIVYLLLLGRLCI